MTRTLYLAAEADTEALGAGLAAALEAIPRSRCVCWLRGDLGVGKTTLVRGLLRGMGHGGRVKSPTYTLVEPYHLADRSVLHCDLYRLVDAGEMDYLGLTDQLDDTALLLVEWPERGGRSLPGPDLELQLDHQPQGRVCHLKAITAIGMTLLAALNRASDVEERGGL